MPNSGQNQDQNSADLARAVAHLEQNLAELKVCVEKIHAILVGETKEIDKSLVWRVQKNEESIKELKEKLAASKRLLLAFILAVAGTFGTALGTWAVNGFPNPWAKDSAHPYQGHSMAGAPVAPADR